MKKRSIAIFVIIMLILLVPLKSFAKGGISLIIDGKLIEDRRSHLINDRTVTPIRSISESLGFNVSWNGQDRTVGLVKDNKKIVIKENDKTAYIDGREYKLDVKPFIVDGTTYVPLRFISEALDREIEWDGKNMVAIVGSYTGPIDYDEYVEYIPYNLGYKLKIPREIESKILINEGKSKIEIVDEYNYKLTKNRGFLFSLEKHTNPSKMELIPSILVKYDKGNYYIAGFASDIQYLLGNKESEVLYEELFSWSKTLLKSFELIK